MVQGVGRCLQTYVGWLAPATIDKSRPPSMTVRPPRFNLNTKRARLEKESPDFGLFCSDESV